MDSKDKLEMDLETMISNSAKTSRKRHSMIIDDLTQQHNKRSHTLDLSAHHSNETQALVAELDKTASKAEHDKQLQSDYYEFIKSSDDEQAGLGRESSGGGGGFLGGGGEKGGSGGSIKSPSSSVSSSSNDSGDRAASADSLTASQQQYYIAVDARTVATLQAGAEYTLVQVDGNGKPEERAYDDDRVWSSGEDGQLKSSDQPQQLLMQTMRPMPGSPHQLHCQADGLVASSIGQQANGGGAGDSFANAAVLFSGSGETTSTPGGKTLVPSTQVKFDPGQHFQQHTPTTSHSSGAYSVVATPHPHMQLYNVAGTPAHHPGSANAAAAFAYQGHRLHVTPATPTAWHGTPYTQSFSPHSRQQGFLTPQQQQQGNTSVSSMSLNSSGEENENVSPDYPRVPHNTPATDASGMFPMATIQRAPTMSQILGPLDNMQYFPIPYTGRENHNEKERKRRSRIKNACALLRDLVPGLSEKTDKATVFEYTVQYLLHLQRHVGKQFDKEFIEKYTPY